jgi:hypothetical protein
MTDSGKVKEKINTSTRVRSTNKKMYVIVTGNSTKIHICDINFLSGFIIPTKKKFDEIFIL